MLLTVGRLISSGYLGNIPPLGLLLAANFSEICEFRAVVIRLCTFGMRSDIWTTQVKVHCISGIS